MYVIFFLFIVLTYTNASQKKKKKSFCCYLFINVYVVVGVLPMLLWCVFDSVQTWMLHTHSSHHIYNIYIEANTSSQIHNLSFDYIERTKSFFPTFLGYLYYFASSKITVNKRKFSSLLMYVLWMFSMLYSVRPYTYNFFSIDPWYVPEFCRLYIFFFVFFSLNEVHQLVINRIRGGSEISSI